MIETVLDTPATEERPSSAPVFMVNSPALNPFVAPGAVSFVESEDHLVLEWTDEGWRVPAPSGAELAEEFVGRCRREAERHSASPRALTNLGVALMAAGDIEEAMDAFAAALKLDGRHYPALAYLARLRLTRDEVDDAERLAKRLKDIFPRDAVARMMLGCIALRQGDGNRALQEIEAACKLDERSALPSYLLGMILLDMRRNRDAIGYLRRATRLDSRSPALQRGLGIAYAASGDLGRATRALRTALALDPGEAETVHALGRILMRRGETDAGVHLLESFIERNPGDLVGQELLARGYGTLGDYRAAKRHLQRALEALEEEVSDEVTGEKARLMNNIGVVCASDGALEEAERWYRRAVDAAPHPIAFRNLYRICADRRGGEAGNRVLNQWLEVFPEDEEAVLRLAVRRAETGEVARSIGDLRKLARSSGVSERAYAALGVVLSDSAREMNAAIEVLEEGYERFPGNAAIANNLAYVYLMKGMPAEARRVLGEVETEEAESSVCLIATWGLLFLWEGNAEKAREWYERASALAEEKGLDRLARTARQKMHLELARYYVRVGERDRGRVEIEKGLAVTGKKEYREELRELRGRGSSAGS